MHCSDFRRRYSEYRDQHDPELAAEMDDHIDVCPGCAAYDRTVREGVQALRGETILPSPSFAQRLEARLTTVEHVPEPLPPRVSPWAATAATILLMTMLALTLKDFRVLPEPVAAEVQPMVLAQPRLVPGMPFIIYEHVRP